MIAIASLFDFRPTISALTASRRDTIGGTWSTAKNRRLSLPSIGDDQLPRPWFSNYDTTSEWSMLAAGPAFPYGLSHKIPPEGENTSGIFVVRRGCNPLRPTAWRTGRHHRQGRRALCRQQD